MREIMMVRRMMRKRRTTNMCEMSPVRLAGCSHSSSRDTTCDGYREADKGGDNGLSCPGPRERRGPEMGSYSIVLGGGANSDDFVLGPAKAVSRPGRRYHMDL